MKLNSKSPDLAHPNLDYNCYGYVVDFLSGALEGSIPEIWFASPDDLDAYKGKKCLTIHEPHAFENEWLPTTCIMEIAYNWKSQHGMILEDNRVYHQIGLNGPLEEKVDPQIAIDNFLHTFNPNWAKVTIDIFQVKKK
jgi:hypothetical protein